MSLPESNGYSKDKFDDLATTVNFAVLDNGQLVGCFRLVYDSEAGLPADHFFPFTQHLEPSAKRVHNSLFCLDRAYRGQRCFQPMILLAAMHINARDTTHIVAPVVEKFACYLKPVGFQQIAPSFIEPHSGRTGVPMVLEIKHINSCFFRQIEPYRQSSYREVYQRVLIRAGESLSSASLPNQTGYLLLSGALSNISHSADSTLTPTFVGSGEAPPVLIPQQGIFYLAKQDCLLMPIQAEPPLSEPQPRVSQIQHAGEMLCGA